MKLKTISYFIGALVFLFSAGLVVNLASDLIYGSLGAFWSVIILILCIILLFMIFHKQIIKLAR